MNFTYKLVHKNVVINCITRNVSFSFDFDQVMDAEKQKAESGALHQEKTLKFHAAESKVR